LADVVIPKRFKKRLARKSIESQGAILRTIQQLIDHGPSYPGLNTHPVRGTGGIYEAYVNDGDRLTYERDGDTLVLRVHCNHDILRAP
jgi:hypothetical protein